MRWLFSYVAFDQCSFLRLNFLCPRKKTEVSITSEGGSSKVADGFWLFGITLVFLHRQRRHHTLINLPRKALSLVKIKNTFVNNVVIIWNSSIDVLKGEFKAGEWGKQQSDRESPELIKVVLMRNIGFVRGRISVFVFQGIMLQAWVVGSISTYLSI